MKSTWLTSNAVEPTGRLTAEDFYKAVEFVKNERDRSLDPFVCIGGLDGYFMSFQFINPDVPRIVHPETHRLLEAMSDQEYGDRMAHGRDQVMMVFERARRRSEDGEDHG